MSGYGTSIAEVASQAFATRIGIKQISNENVEPMRKRREFKNQELIWRLVRLAGTTEVAYGMPHNQSLHIRLM